MQGSIRLDQCVPTRPSMCLPHTLMLYVGLNQECMMSQQVFDPVGDFPPSHHGSINAAPTPEYFCDLAPLGIWGAFFLNSFMTEFSPQAGNNSAISINSPEWIIWGTGGRPAPIDSITGTFLVCHQWCANSPDLGLLKPQYKGRQWFCHGYQLWWLITMKQQLIHM